jgi:hypothetical protein
MGGSSGPGLRKYSDYYRIHIAFKYQRVLSYLMDSSNYNVQDLSRGKEVKGKAIPVTGRGGPQGCMTSRLPHFLHNRLTDGGEVVSLTRRPPFTRQEDSWYSFLLEAESTPGP